MNKSQIMHELKKIRDNISSNPQRAYLWISVLEYRLENEGVQNETS